MRSFTPALTKNDKTPPQEPANFNWMEAIAVPLAIGAMEAQFGVLAFVIGSLLFTGTSETLPLIEGSVMLIWWSAYWWAWLAKRQLQPRFGEARANLSYLPALFVVFVLLVGLHPAFVQSVPQLICASGLSLSFWSRGMARVGKSSQEESLLALFQAGFIILLGLLVLALIYPPPAHAVLIDALSTVLPLFCLSGLTALSLSSLSSKYRAGRARKDFHIQRTRTGLLTLFVLAVIGAATTLLSALLLEPLEAIFSPLLDRLRAFFNWLLSLFHAEPAPRPPVLKRPPEPGIDVYPHALSSFPSPLEGILRLLLIAGIALLTLFMLLALLWLIRRMLRQKDSANEDEIRESISARSILRRRFREKGVSAQESVDAASARARYREFLHALERQAEDEQKRRPNETPTEYQRRLLSTMKPAIHGEVYTWDTPGDAEILEELTGAYLLERYGEKRPDERRLAFLRRWVPLLTGRMIRKKWEKI